MFRILADGSDITANIADRLLSLSVRDEAEDKSDTVALRVDDRKRSGTHAALPEVGTALEIALSDAGRGLISVGTYVVDEIRYTSPPETLEVRAKAAKMPSAFRSGRNQSWHKVRLGEIVQEIGGQFGFTVRIHPDLARVFITHADQTGESPMAFLTRLARDADAVMRPANGALLFLPRGGGITATGESLPVYTLTPSDCTRWSFSHSARTTGGSGQSATGGVKTVHWDATAQEMREHTAGEPPYQTLRFAQPDDDTAASLARSAQRERARKTKELTFERPGDAALMADQKIQLAGFRAQIPTEWRAVSVEHRIDGSGYATSVKAEVLGTA